jgi:hypothetical protein
MDADLQQMSREQLVKEVQKLREGIRAHRDSKLHELCWHHPAYRQSLDLQAPDAPRSSERYKE